MAEETINVTVGADAPPTPMPEQWEFTPRSMASYLIFLIGAGGTGARVASLIPRIIRPSDRVVVVDPDRIEERNLLRQHFLPRDVGEYKAEVVATRIQAALNPQTHTDVEVLAINEPWEAAILSRAGLVDGARRTFGIIYLGCVDNHDARRTIHTTMQNLNRSRSIPQVWIDAGNEMHTGQVILSATLLPGWYGGLSMDPTYLVREESRRDLWQHFNYPGVLIHAKELLEPQPRETAPACRLRLDLQTVGANQTAATIMGNMLTCVIDGLPITSPMIEFSILPQLVRGVPFNAEKIRGNLQ